MYYAKKFTWLSMEKLYLKFAVKFVLVNLNLTIFIDGPKGCPFLAPTMFGHN